MNRAEFRGKVPAVVRHIIIVLALSSVALATSACPEKGPAEKAGEKIDKAIDKTKDAVK
jgi:hypothetical protein